MKTKSFAGAIEDALAQAMAKDPNIIILGEDVHTLRRNLFVRFGKERVRATPISEGAFVGAAVAAAMAGLRPVVEVMMVDFIAVAVDALLNHAAMIKTFSGGVKAWKTAGYKLEQTDPLPAFKVESIDAATFKKNFDQYCVLDIRMPKLYTLGLYTKYLNDEMNALPPEHRTKYIRKIPCPTSPKCAKGCLLTGRSWS